MDVNLIVFFLLNLVFAVRSSYQPTGEEVQPGSVLLPATRRGRYLANIVRRQAVDGTGIKFNKDADRMNAEAKKKVDVLSEELLPYIIAEQERRASLYKRVMTAIQNGEKGVTIAEIRNKPPVLIRKGLLYRCPANRAPKEPDGSGLMMCEDDIQPTQIMYESCLSAEDKELYNAENKYFFCNRHKIEGPDLPRNGTTVIGCAPIERTSRNYTVDKCTLEDTDDVVVHYRYYPDRTYKFVTELDPDREVCDHWNPCQIGYIYSLPSVDQALPASELWQDSLFEGIHYKTKNYTTSNRMVKTPGTPRRTDGGYTFKEVKMKGVTGPLKEVKPEHVSSTPGTDSEGNSYVTIQMTFDPWETAYFGTYYAVFSMEGAKDKLVRFVQLVQSQTYVEPQREELSQGQRKNGTRVPFKCNRCRLQGIIIRSVDGNVYNLDSSKFKIRTGLSARGTPNLDEIEINLEGLKPNEFGDFFAIVQNADGNEERLKAVSINSPVVTFDRQVISFEEGEHYDKYLDYSCGDTCELADILCNGEIVTNGRVSPLNRANQPSVYFNFPSFNDSFSCVYIGFFKVKDKVYKKVLAVFDTVSIQKKELDPPKEGEPIEEVIPFSCANECDVKSIFVNGYEIKSKEAEDNGAEPEAYFEVTDGAIVIHISSYKPTYEGYYQAVYTLDNGNETITKTILEIKDPSDTGSGGGQSSQNNDTVNNPNENPGDAGGTNNDTDSNASNANDTDTTNATDTGTNKTAGAGIVVTRLPSSKSGDATWECESCELEKVTCKGADTAKPLVDVIAADKKVTFTLPDPVTEAEACVYMAVFKDSTTQVLAIVEANGDKLTVEPAFAAEEGKDGFTKDYTLKADPPETEITGIKVTINGEDAGALATAVDAEKKVTIKIEKFDAKAAGVYQVEAKVGEATVIKAILELKMPATADSGEGGTPADNSTDDKDEKGFVTLKATMAQAEAKAEPQDGVVVSCTEACKVEKIEIGGVAVAGFTVKKGEEDVTATLTDGELTVAITGTPTDDGEYVATFKNKDEKAIELSLLKVAPKPG